MQVLGITGGIGMGKSTAGALLAERGVVIIDTDILARQESEVGSQGLQEIVTAFGLDFLEADGALNRAKLAQVIFSDRPKRERLEAILHPKIAKAWRSEVGRCRQEGQSLVGVLIPLLFERGYQDEFTAVVSVACSEASQYQRLRLRGWDDQQIKARNAAQMSPVEKMTRAKMVVWSEGSLRTHGRQWDRILTTCSPV